MKKILQLFILVLLANASFAQVLFQQDFESGTLGTMTIVDADGLTPNTNVGLLTEAWNVLEGTSSLAALSTSWFTPPGTADDWLITPQLSIADEKTVISWEAICYNQAYPDGYEVLVSVTDNEIASFTDVIFSIPAEQASEVAKRSASLADYVGKDIYIAFRNNSYDGTILQLDNIIVEELPAIDVSVNSFNIKRFQLAGVDIPVSVTIQNSGFNMLTSLDLTWSDGINSYTDNVTELSLASGETATLTHTQMLNLPTVGDFQASVSVSNPNGEEDEASEDNMMMARLGTVETNPNRKVVVEEGTGTWCGWCPRGTVGLATMAEKYPDNFIGIAVHNADPMAVTDYDGPLGISAFPGSKVNRSEEDIDPSAEDLDGQVATRRNEVTPASAWASAIGDKETRSIEITVGAEFFTPLSGDDFRFAAVIIEDGVTGTGSNYAQANFYSGGGQGPMGGYENLPNPVPASDMVYDHVARAILGGFDGATGSIPAEVNVGDKPSYDFSYTVPLFYDMDNMKVVVLLLDNSTGEIYNADEVDVEFPVSTTEIVDESISRIYPNPVTGLANIEINLIESSEVNLQVIDMVGKTVSNQYLGKLYGNNKMTYDVSNLEAGMYFFRVTAGDLVSTKKITVIK